MKNKRILIVTHQFLPFVSPRTTRWSLLIDELVGKGNEVTVLSGTNPENIEKIMMLYISEIKNFHQILEESDKNLMTHLTTYLKKIFIQY